jgi:uncharacterized protein (DUF1697 family)
MCSLARNFMETYLSLLRGINIGGNNKINMADLCLLYEELSFRNITSYIQSGNVIFDAKSDEKLALKIENKIAKKFKLNITVVIRNMEQIRKVIEENPFSDNENPRNRYVLFLNQKPDEEKKEKLSDINFEPEKYFITNNEIYVYCANGYGKAKLTSNFFESKLNIRATARSWRTVNELYKLFLGRKV